MRLKTELAPLLVVLFCQFCPLMADMPMDLRTGVAAALVARPRGEGCETTFEDISDDTPSLAVSPVTFPGMTETFYYISLPGCGSGPKYFFLTRDARPRMYDTNMISDVYDEKDGRLWRVAFCGLKSQNAFSATLYWIDDKRKARVLGVENNKLALIPKDLTDGKPNCFDSGFYVFLYPSGNENMDLCIQEILTEIRDAAIYTSRLGKRDISESPGRLLRLTIAIDGEQYMVVRSCKEDGTFSNELVIEPFRYDHLTAGSLFYYKSYSTVNGAGELENVTGEVTFTLFHAMTGQFLTVDVDDLSLSLKIGNNLTGLTFKDANGFFESPLLDRRHFKLYAGAQAFCSVHYRRFCVRPTKSGMLRLYPVDAGNTSPRPTFKDPTKAMFSAFNSASRLLANSVQLPTFAVFERRAVVALGSPEILYISEYTASPGNAQSVSVLSYDPATNTIRLTSRSQALLSPYRIVRQQWTEPGSSAVYISLQVVSGEVTSFSYSGLYITRLSTSPVQINSPFGSVDVDIRLFSSLCCFCSQNVYDVQRVYSNRGCHAVSLAIAQNGTLVLRENNMQSTPSCQTYGLTMSTS